MTTNVDGEGSIELNPPGGTYALGTVVTLEAKPAEGYKFQNWSGDLIGNENPATITMNTNKTVTAVFVSETKTYGLTVNVNDPAMGSVTVTRRKMRIVGNRYAEALVNNRYKFKQWVVLKQDPTNPVEITMDADKTMQ